MNTFVVSCVHAKTMYYMDTPRLGKQRVEVLQIARYLTGVDPEFTWRNHPAVLMWQRHAHELLRYGIAACDEWVGRGHADTTGDRLRKMLAWYSAQTNCDRLAPSWVADPRHHVAHQSNLIRKYPEHYRRYWPKVPDDFPYIWWRYDIPARLWIPSVPDLAGYHRLLEYTKAHTNGRFYCLGTSIETPMDLSRSRTSVILGPSLSPPSAPPAPTTSVPSPPSPRS